MRKNDQKNKFIALRISNEMHSFLLKHCEEEKKDISDTIREMLYLLLYPKYYKPTEMYHGTLNSILSVIKNSPSECDQLIKNLKDSKLILEKKSDQIKLFIEKMK